MIEGDRVVGIIPARGGSKGIPRKNVIPLAGKPLIAWTIEAALASQTLDRVVLSSDNLEIMQVAEAHGCDVPFRRPDRLAQDDTPSIAPVLHALEQLPDFEYVVLLQPTSPLRAPADIDGAVALCVASGASSCVSVAETGKPPEWTFRLGEDKRLSPVLPSAQQATRRQEATSAYTLNGAVYVCNVEALRSSQQFVMADTVGYAMPVWRSADVDSEFDLRWCEFLLHDSGGSTEW